MPHTLLDSGTIDDAGKLGASIVNIGPILASEILSKNLKNRPVDRGIVERYCTAIARGEWKLSHQGIALDEDGYLLDGQHRLEAVKKSGMTVAMVVFTGIARSNFSSIDTGKRRSGANVLSLMGIPDSNHLAAALRYLHMYDLKRSNWHSTRSRLTNDQLISLYKSNLGMLDCVRLARPVSSSTGIISSACATGMYITRRSAPNFLDDDWLSGVTTGANLPADDPRLAFRRFFTSSRAKEKRRVEAEEHVAIYIKSWNLWARNESRKIISYRKGEMLPVPVNPNRVPVK